ncbi:11751_t:CDS:2, partial [Racocetra persica]
SSHLGETFGMFKCNIPSKTLLKIPSQRQKPALAQEDQFSGLPYSQDRELASEYCVQVEDGTLG